MVYVILDFKTVKISTGFIVSLFLTVQNVIAIA